MHEDNKGPPQILQTCFLLLLNCLNFSKSRPTSLLTHLSKLTWQAATSIPLAKEIASSPICTLSMLRMSFPFMCTGGVDLKSSMRSPDLILEWLADSIDEILLKTRSVRYLLQCCRPLLTISTQLSTQLSFQSPVQGLWDSDLSWFWVWDATWPRYRLIWTPSPDWGFFNFASEFQRPTAESEILILVSFGARIDFWANWWSSRSLKCLHTCTVKIVSCLQLIKSKTIGTWAQAQV